MTQIKELKDILIGIEDERTPEEFLLFMEGVIKHFKTTPKIFEKEITLKKKDSDFKDTAKKLREEIGPLYNLVKNKFSYFKGTTLQYFKGNQQYDVKVNNHNTINYLEITRAVDGKKEHENDMTLFKERGLLRSGGLEVVEPLIKQIEFVLSKKINKKYPGKFALLIGFDDIFLSSDNILKEFNKQITARKLNVGSFVDVFLVGDDPNGICQKLE